MAKSKSAYKRWVFALISICAFASAVIAGSMLLKDGGLRLPFFTQETDASHASVRVEYRTEYLKCEDSLVEIGEYPSQELTAVMAALSGNWTVTKEDGREVRLLRQVDEYCDTHHRCRLLTIYRGYVCVFRGKEPDPHFLVRERLDIPEAVLLQKDKDYLRAGHVIEAGPDVPHDKVSAYLDKLVSSHLIGIAGMKEH